MHDSIWDKALWSERAPTDATIIQYEKIVHSGVDSDVNAVFTPLGHRWDAAYAGAALLPPLSANPHTGGTFLGTDVRGHDVLVRMLAGARISIIGFIATGIAFVIGIAVGAISGYFGGLIDILLQRLLEIVMTFPTLILLLLVASLIIATSLCLFQS